MEKKIGVYVCHCGTNIAGYLDVEKVTEFAQNLPSVDVAQHYTFMCSEPGQELIKQDIKERGLDGVLVCSCSPTLHLRTFRDACQDAGLNPYQCEMASIREHCSWVHSHNPEVATEKAMSLVAAGIRHVIHDSALKTKWAPVHPDTLVLGGGIAGIQAALEIADSGHKVYLVERKPSIGGRVAQLDQTFPRLDSASRILNQKIDLVGSNEYIELMTNSELVEVSGYIGNFMVKVKRKAGDGGQEVDQTKAIDLEQEDGIVEVEVGAIIVATGYDTFDPTPISQYGYKRYDNVITGLEFEGMCSAAGPTGGEIVLKDGSTPQSVAIIHCVGSRDENYHEYCSRICCMYGLKHAHLIKEKTGAEVYQMYIDMRCFGKGHEEFYKSVSDEGINFIRGKPAQVTDVAICEEEKGKLIVVGEDTLLGSMMRVPVDMVILSVAIEPRSDAGEVARLFSLGRSADGFFLERHPKLDPVGTMIDGIHVVGCCQGPKDIPDTVAQASAAAAKALSLISKGSVEIEAATAVVDVEACNGCGYCEVTCAYSAVAVDPRSQVAKVNEAVCKGCGACAVNCPSKAIQLKNFTPKQMIDMINVATEEYAGLAK
ncbi:CoB--CoM heterodisulfide reductase iron-sulfur subunit A family protein [Chloroflexota bacterium]